MKTKNRHTQNYANAHFAEKELFATNYVEKAARFLKNLCAFYKQAINSTWPPTGGSEIGHSNKGPHEPPYTKAHESTIQKANKNFAIKKGGEADPIKTNEVYNYQYTSYQLSNDQYLNDQYTNGQNKRGNCPKNIKLLTTSAELAEAQFW